jgi:tripartite-type tricarboxylate transporter receptor subunit TctC
MEGRSLMTGRIVAVVMGERLGTPMVVENCAGAGGIIGTELAANAARDGYTLLTASLAHVVSPRLYDLKGRFHPIRSFAPVAIIERLDRKVSAMQELPEIRKQFDNDGATVLRMTPAQFGACMAADMEKWGREVRAAGIKAN